MARILGLFPAALLAAREGMSANKFYQQLQAQGEGGRRAEVLQLFSVAKSVVTANPHEAFQDQSLAPVGSELAAWPTRKAEGIRQNVTLVYRDKVTGQLKQTFWSTIGSTALTREQAVSQAVDAYAGTAEAYGQDLVDAVHVSAYRLVPDMLSE